MRRRKNKYVLKPYQLGSRQVDLQGYEPQVLTELLEWFGPEDIFVCSEGLVPSFRYKLGKRLRLYLPDFFIPHLGIIVEVKSTYTLCAKPYWWHKNREKARQVISEGYRFKLVVWESNRCMILPNEWVDWKLEKLRSFLRSN